MSQRAFDNVNGAARANVENAQDIEIIEIPDFVKLAEAYGCVGLRARTKEEAIAAIERANEITDRPVLIDFLVWKDAMVWPMVAAGDSNDNVMLRPGIRPLQTITMHEPVDDANGANGVDGENDADAADANAGAKVPPEAAEAAAVAKEPPAANTSNASNAAGAANGVNGAANGATARARPVRTSRSTKRRS